jgi:autophagy-related protein 2
MFYNESASIRNESEDNDSDYSDDECDNVYRSEMVMIGQLANRQEIRINMKLAEQIGGPKVSLDMSLGALTLFFTPRQLHMLLLLCDIVLNEAPSSGSDNEILKEMSPPRPSRVEEEKRRFGGLMAHQTWSGEDYDCNSEFTSAREMHAINKLRPVETDSVFSSNSSSMTSSIGSSASANTSRRRRAIERDQNADISHFSIRVAGVYVVILHDDVLMATTKIRNDESPLNESSVEKLKQKCEHFFNCVAESSGTYSTSDLIKIGNMLKAACDNNHLRLMFAPIIVDGEERRTTKGNCTKLNVSISRADIHEILGELCLPLLEFQRKDSTAIIPEQPEVSINIEKTFYVMRSSSGKQFTAPRLNLGLTLGVAKFEFDITIFDRLNALFSSPFTSFMSDGSAYEQDTSELPPSSQKIVQSKSKIKIQSDCFSLVVRFPIVDLRPLHDPEKRPWWQRHVRPDFLVLKFSDFQLNYISPSTYDVMAGEINVLYHESEKASAIKIARASLYEHTANKYYSSSTDYPRIVVQFPTDAQLLDLNESFIREQSDGRAEDTDSDPASGESIKINPIKEKESTPFSTKKVCRESDTPHGKDNDGEFKG